MTCIKKEIIKFDNIFLLLLPVGMLILFFMKPWNNLKDYVIQQQGSTSSYTEIYGSAAVSQTFIVDEVFDSIELLMLNDKHIDQGEFIVRLYNDLDTCIYEKEVQVSDLNDDWFEIPLENKIYASRGCYKIEVTAPKLKKDNGVVIFSSDTKTYADGIMSINEVQQDKTLCFAVYESRKNIFAYIALFIFAVTAAAWWINRKKSIMRTAVIVLTGLGLCMLVMMAPMSAPDDKYHYQSAFVLSNIMSGGQNVYQFPAEYLEFEGFQIHYNANTAFIRVMEDVLDTDSDLTHAINFGGNGVNGLYHPIAYAAPALGILSGRLLGLNMVLTHYLGRLFNLFLYLFLTLLAVWMIPKYKELLLLTASLPMCLHQAVSYSYDVIINGMSFVILAYILKLIYQKERVTWKNALVLAVLGAVMCPGKIVYAAFMLLVLLIPKDQFENRKDRWLKTLFILCSILFVIVLSQYPVFVRFLNQSGQVSAVDKYTIWFIIAHPFKFIQILYNTFFVYIIEWGRQSIGIRLAGLSLTVSDYLVFGFSVLLLLYCLQKDNRELIFNKSQKVICCLSAAVGMIFIVSVLFLDTLFGLPLIIGVQGRYFIPFIAPVLIGLNTKKIKVEIERKYLMTAYWFLWAGILNDILSSVSFISENL